MSKKWLKLKKYIEVSGEPKTTVMQKINDNVYRIGIIAKKDPVNKTWWINTEAQEQWLENSKIKG